MLSPLSQYLAIGKLLALLGAVALICWQSSQIHSAREQARQCVSARHADRAAYTQAQKDAQAANAAQLQRIQSEQQRITNNVQSSYENDLARLRAELARRLPQGGTTAAKGAAVNPGASPVPNPTSGVDAEPRVSIPSSLYVRGAELELQLEALQQWVRRQLAVDPNR